MSAREAALVTGAGGGIGPATVAAPTADGWRAVGTARTPGRAAGDLADHGAVDLLVNNAGAVIASSNSSTTTRRAARRSSTTPQWPDGRPQAPRSDGDSILDGTTAFLLPRPPGVPAG
jgi:NAD(P)-dependent dehydrogenase (short-subunit alcohol dehydrogenase family)